MQNFKRDSLGFIDLEELGCILDRRIVYIGDKKYYYKNSMIGIYKELVIDELAKDYGIRCAEYDMASFSDCCGLISKDLNSDGNSFVPMYDILSKFYHATDYRTIKQYNNLDEIGFVLEQQFDHDTFQKLINQLDDIYLFDRLIGNNDRNSTNYGLLYHDGDVDFIIIDNETSFDYDVIYEDCYQLKRGRNRDDSTDLSADKVKEWCKYLTDDHIDEVFNRVEQKIQAPINSSIKSKFKTFFRTSSDIISKKIPNSYVK